MMQTAIARISLLFFMLTLAGCETNHVTDAPDDLDPAVATRIFANPGWSPAAFAGTAVTVPPSVTVTDQRGAGIAGVTVTFAVSVGGGSVTGASAVTSFSGVATVGGWVLGPTVGPNVLIASVSGLPAVTFQSNSTVDLAACGPQSIGAYLLGTIRNGDLTATDCYSDGVYFDQFLLTLDSAGAYSLTESATFETYLSINYPDGRFIADTWSFAQNPTMKVLLPAGTYIVNASSLAFDQTGPYSLSSAKTSADVSGCERVFATRGVTSSQSVQSTDCVRPNGAGYGDEFGLYLGPGPSVTVSMTSETIDSYLELYYVDYTGVRTFIGSNDNGGAAGTKNARFTYTPVKEGFVVIVARTGVAGETGSYVLNIQ